MLLTVETSGEHNDDYIYVKQGGNFTITCMASGGPNNTHIWRLDDVIITNSMDEFDISTSVNDSMSVSVLSIDKVDAATHKGSYTCEVLNEAGDHFGGLTVHGMED